jgi:hypothetical protein
LVTVYVVLRIPALDEDELKLYISRLSINLEAQAVGQTVVRPAEGPHPPQMREVKELLASEPVNILDDPLILATELQAEGDSDSYQYIYLFWKSVIPIGESICLDDQDSPHNHPRPSERSTPEISRVLYTNSGTSANQCIALLARW